MKLIHKKSGILFAGILFSIITGILIWGRYEIYREQLAISVAYTEVQDENQGAVLLKKKPELTEEEVEDYLVSHGFESITTTIYGKAFLKESFFIVFLESVLALGAVGWIAWEKKKTEDSCIKKLEQIGQELDCMCQGREWTENRGWEEEGEQENNSVQQEYLWVRESMNSLWRIVSQIQVQAFREKEETKALVTDISHQLKTPVAALKSTFEILEKENLSEEEKAEFKERASCQIRGLECLLEALLNISRMETGMISIKRENGRIFETVVESVNRVWDKADRKNVEIVFDGEKGIETLEIPHDRKWLGEALINLLDNGIKYSPSHTVISIGLYRRNSFLRIEVTDEGRGILPKEYHKVFQRFYRGEQVKDENIEGSGVGLYLTRKIVEQHHGTVFIDSSSKRRKGTTFVLQIPYV